MDSFNQLLTSLADDLKGFGFTKSQSTFYKKNDDNRGLINFQKSSASNSASVLFTINFGIFSKSLNDYYQTTTSKKPGMVNCHWSERIGAYLSPKHDKWWTVDEKTSLASLKAEILPLLTEIVIPVVNSHISDELLVSAWLNGEYGGNTEVQKIKHLIILLSKSDRARLIDFLKKTYSEKKMDSIIRYDLEEFGIKELI